MIDRTNPPLDTYHRPMRSLRISVTDRCNLRCQYCMPEDEYVWVNRQEILSFEEIAALVEIFTGLGVSRLRLTGGDPLLRHNLGELVSMLRQNPCVEDLALTTNGVLLGRMARPLRRAGLDRVTISLDTLDAGRFRVLTRSGAHAAVLEGIDEALAAGFESVKVNTVVMRNFNGDEIPGLLEFGRRKGVEIRFIEYMDVGGATRWAPKHVVSRAEILGTIEDRFGAAEPLFEAPSGPGKAKAPADRFRLADGAVFGIISSTTLPFCGTCDRSRLTTDGVWFLCLYASGGIDLKAILRRGVPAAEMARTIKQAWELRTDRGAEERNHLKGRGVLFPVEQLRMDVHREMHTRGG